MSSADISMVFEETYQAFKIRNSTETLGALPDDRCKLGCIMHSVPNLLKGDFICLVQQLRDVSGNIFLTDLDTNYYVAFGNLWTEFIEAMS